MALRSVHSDRWMSLPKSFNEIKLIANLDCCVGSWRGSIASSAAFLLASANFHAGTTPAKFQRDGKCFVSFNLQGWSNVIDSLVCIVTCQVMSVWKF